MRDHHAHAGAGTLTELLVIGVEQLQRSEIPKWAKVIKEAGIKAD
jgi:hypothetical protein